MGELINSNYPEKPAVSDTTGVSPQQFEETKAAADSAQLQDGLSGNKGKDLGKGVTVQKSNRIDTGNGVYRIENPDGSVEFEIDDSVYDGHPLLFDKNTKVRHINTPKQPEKSFLAKVNDAITTGINWLNKKGNAWSHGQIRGLGRGTATMTAVVSGSAAPVAGGSTGANVALTALTSVLASCGDATDDNGLSSPDPNAKAKAELNYNPRSFDIVNDRCKILNMPNEEFDEAINNNSQLTDAEKSKLTNLDFSKKTSDGIEFKYGAEKLSNGDGQPYIMVGEDIKLYLFDTLSTDNVLSYIEKLDPDLKCDGVGLDFGKNEKGEPKVVIKNGFTHNVGDDVKVKEDSALGTMKSMISAMGFEDAQEPMQISEDNLLLDFKVGQSNYSNEQNNFEKNSNFAFELVERGDLNKVTNGNPQVKMKVFEQEITGKLFNENGDVVVKGDNDEELVRLSQEKEYNLGTDEYPDNYDGVLVKVKGKEFAFMWRSEYNGKVSCDMGKIDRENGTFMTTYKSVHSDFNTKDLAEADKYYEKKKENLDNAKDLARGNYNYLSEKLRTEAIAEVEIK